jgi:hypothetical protein
MNMENLKRERAQRSRFDAYASSAFLKEKSWVRVLNAVVPFVAKALRHARKNCI